MGDVTRRAWLGTAQLPRTARRARRRVLHSGGVKGRAPAALVVLSQSQVEALAVHVHGDMSDARARSRAKHAGRRARGRHGEAPAEAEGGREEAVSGVEHVATLLARGASSIRLA